MISKELQQAFNEQIVEELYSSNLYMAMSLYLSESSFDGFAHWMMKQANEEMEHARKMAQFVITRGGHPEIGAIEAVKKTWKDPLQIFEEAYEHECHISQCINDLLDKAREEGDKAAEGFCWGFVREQVEEEATAAGIVDKLRNMGNGTIFPLDHALGQR